MASYGTAGAPAPESNSEQAQLLATSAAKGAFAYVKTQLLRAREFAGKGPLSFRILALIGGVAMTVVAAFSVIGHLTSLSPLKALIQAYLCIFGLLVVVLEGRNIIMTHKLRQLVHEYAKFLTFVWGRGLFYIFAGSFMFCQWTLMNLIVGGYMLAVGVLCVGVGGSTASKLVKLQKTMSSESVVRQRFTELDKNNSGSLESAELAELCASLGSELNHNELVAAISVMDKDRNNKITYEEFYTWWACKYNDDKHAMMQV